MLLETKISGRVAPRVNLDRLAVREDHFAVTDAIQRVLQIQWSRGVMHQREFARSGELQNFEPGW